MRKYKVHHPPSCSWVYELTVLKTALCELSLYWQKSSFYVHLVDPSRKMLPFQVHDLRMGKGTALLFDGSLDDR